MPVKPFGLPPLEAIKLIKAKGYNLKESFDWRDMWASDHAAAFTVAKSAGFDILDDIYKSVLKAQEGKLTYKQFVAELSPTLMQKGWWGRKEVVDPATGEVVDVQLGSARRLKTIYETNLRTAQAAGKWTQIQALKRERPFLRYCCIVDARTREEHKQWHGLILPVDHPFWKDHYPPNGWHCRCYVMQLSQADLDRYGWKVSTVVPDFGKTVFRNERTGEILAVPKGLDPAFANNAGIIGVEVQSARALGRNLGNMNPQLASAATAASADFVAKALAPDLRAMYEDIESGAHARGRKTVVGALRPEVLQWLEAHGAAPQSGAITLADKQLAHMMRDAKAAKGTAISKNDVLNLPNILASPKAILRDRHGAILYVFDSTGDDRKSKVVVELDYKWSQREEGMGKKEITSLTSIKTATRVSENNLKGSHYEVISGSI
ncbi:hypothetical protein C4J81_15405 [Deltaproteobacteria bacterium Smac51]|nr:hypothetical protein C4J81_10140 [Deltaproteobacteria bacterium Smac51]UQZ90517.1 hypothetical protein C4J81_15405 [Deltaproteobacteria bacterium Smac51]